MWDTGTRTARRQFKLCSEPLLAASVDGIVNKIDPGAPADEDLYVMDEKKQARLTALPRNLLEAILWHGGEAQAQRDAVVQLNAEQRQQLLAFIESL